MNQSNGKEIDTSEPYERSPNTPVPTEQMPVTDPPNFEFVGDVGSSNPRSHAMKSYWRQKKSKQRHWEKTKLSRPTLRPFPLKDSRETDKLENPPSQSQSQSANDDYFDIKNLCIQTSTSSISEQLFSGISFVLASSLGQNIVSSSSHISADHHRYFYHWLSMHADVIQTGLESQNFTPFRDIWIPLDLSNTASFNGILAHAAADLDKIGGGNTMSKTLKYKTEAIETINKWLGSSTSGVVKDEVLAGVIRLLTFERCWGTQERFEMHKYGLRRLADTRGGYRAFHADWRLQIVISLLDSIRAPEQFPLVAYLQQGYENLVFEMLGVAYVTHESSRRIKILKRLWSFVSLTEMMNTLRNRQKWEEKAFANTLIDTQMALQHLKSLLFIWATLEEKDKMTGHEPGQKEEDSLLKLDTFLKGSRHVWNCSDNDVLSMIWNEFSQRIENRHITQFVMVVAESLKENGPKAMWGLKQCLLNYWS